MRRLFLSAALLLLTQCSRCKDDPDPQPKLAPAPQLPAETQTGANTFGCLVNGQVWSASPAYFSPTLTAHYTAVPGQEELTVSASNYRTPIRQTIYFRLRGINQVGRFLLTGGRPRYVEFADDSPNVTCVEYDTLNSVQAGVIDITRLDRVQRVVAGRFSFTLRRAGCPDVQATDGRFDLKF